MDYYTKTTSHVLSELQSSEDGLSNTEAAQRLREYGQNILAIKGEPLWRKIIEPFANLFMLVLFLAVAVSFWHKEYIDAVIIGAIMFINAAIYYVQRFSTERILRALQKKSHQLVDVLRDGESIQIDVAQIVPGDVVVLDEGEKIPADCRLLETASLRVDESQMTGESLPIEKQAESIEGSKEVYEQSNMVFQGSFVIGGQAKAVVVATGQNTEFGKLAALSVGPSEESPVQQKVNRLISIIIRVIAGVTVVAFALALYRGMELAEAIRYVLALSVSAVPESLPVAITVVLVLGMRRMAKKKALVKSPAAIETIGVLTVIASDKTGTLTKNKLTVQQSWDLSEKKEQIIKAVARSVLPQASKTRDPLDVAMQDYVPKMERINQSSITTSLPFDQKYAMSGNIVSRPGSLVLWVKGSPEHIIERCNMTAEERKRAHSQVQSMAGNGLRVLALAYASLPKELDNVNGFDDLPTQTKFTFVGLLGVADVLRPEVNAAIKRAHTAGVEVCMVTGDHFETAFHIGKQLGIVVGRDEVFDSRKMHTMSDAELSKIVKDVRVFARVIPEDKQRLLTILKQTHVTAMTGDGVNDVPALTGAHVGIAMGGGTAIAKEAGDVILLDNNFRSVVDAIHEGRTIYANIKRMVAYLLSTNAGEVLVALGSLIIGVPVPLVSVQILWVNLVTDTSMVIPLGLEPGEKRNMLRSPQLPNSPLFSHFMLSRIILTAVTMAILTLVIYKIFIALSGVEYARTIAFNALVVMQWASAFNSRSDYESLFRRIRKFSGAFYIGLTAAVLTQLFAMSGFLHEVLHLSSVGVHDVVATSVISFFIPIIVIETHKWVGRQFFQKGVKLSPT